MISLSQTDLADLAHMPSWKSKGPTLPMPFSPRPKNKALLIGNMNGSWLLIDPPSIWPFLWFLGGSSWTRKWLILITIDEFSSPKDRVVGPLPNGWSINGGDPITTEAKVLGWDPPRGGLLGTLQLGSSILLMATRNPDSDHHLGMVLKGLSKYWDQHLPKGAVWTLRDGGFLAPQTSSLPGTPKGRSRDKTSNFNWLHSRMLSIHFFSSPRKCPNWSQISGQRLWQLYMCYLGLNEGGDCDGDFSVPPQKIRQDTENLKMFLGFFSGWIDRKVSFCVRSKRDTVSFYWVPSCELTYPIKIHFWRFWRWVSFSPGGIC